MINTIILYKDTDFLIDDIFKKNNDYDPDKKIGEMHIYSDGRPMEYIAV